jgi:hypothetical protein
MSLVSASGIVGGLKEYMYRGMQQLPLVLGTTSTVMTVITGSVAHANIVLGLLIIMPLFTYLSQGIIGYFFSKNIGIYRSTGDTCNIIPESYSSSKAPPLLDSFIKGSKNDKVVPSYWITSLGFFIGYIISNAADNLITPAQPSGDAAGIEKRTTQSIIVLTVSCVFALCVLIARFRMMGGCEGRSMFGYGISIVFTTISAIIGYYVYRLSRVCGARSSDLFGILSQMLPTSSTTRNPIVCSAT